MTPNAEIFVFANQTLGPIEGPLFGQFIELTGRCINGGLYDPASPQARPDGLRADSVQALKELRPTHLRYPGGCATAYFDWQELVGPKESRPSAKLFRTSQQVQSTGFGIPEVLELCNELGAELFLTINAHTQSPEDAANLVEYLNGTWPTKWANLRRSHGREEPYNVKLFGLGNEIYGDWQPGQKTAEEYTRWCKEAIIQMKSVDPDITVVACGLGRPGPAWDRTVVTGLLEHADMISIHNYFGRPIFRDSMVASQICEQMMHQLNVNIDEVLDANLQHKGRPGIAFDEWNVWYRTTHSTDHDLEEIYTYTDALTVASLLHVVLRNTATVKLANISLLANSLGLIYTDPQRLARQTIFHAHTLLRDAHAGRAVQTAVDGPTFAGKHERFFCGIVDVEGAKDETKPSLVHFPHAPALDVVASIDGHKLTLSVINKLEDQPLTTRLSFRGVEPKGDSITVRRLTGGEDLEAKNTLDHPDRVGIAEETVKLGETFTFPAASLTVLEFEV